MLPYFSRRIGLVEDTEVPIIAGGKVNGRIGETNFGGLVVGTNDKPGVVEDERADGRRRGSSTTCGGSRGSARSPRSAIRSDAPAAGSTGADFTYATSHFRGDKNFLVGVWGLATGREDLGGDATAHGLQDRLSRTISGTSR